jgi:N6-L-threonylcarbamoyladenine synthase
MEAHALTARMVEQVEFPFLVLLVSGGHCLLAMAQVSSEMQQIIIELSKR